MFQTTAGSSSLFASPVGAAPSSRRGQRGSRPHLHIPLECVSTGCNGASSSGSTSGRHRHSVSDNFETGRLSNGYSRGSGTEALQWAAAAASLDSAWFAVCGAASLWPALACGRRRLRSRKHGGVAARVMFPATADLTHIVEGPLNGVSEHRAAPKTTRKKPRRSANTAEKGDGEAASDLEDQHVAAQRGACGSAKNPNLDEQILQFASAVFPAVRHKRPKMEILARVRKSAKEVFGEEAEVFPFGSTANGCGKGNADLDSVIHAPEPKVAAAKALKKLTSSMRRNGLRITERRLSAKIPILTCQMKGAAWCPCDVSFNNLQGVLNSHLLREYAELDPEMAIIAVVVKTWTKAVGVNGTPAAYISSYTWTLMVIYYFQVKHALPSLQALSALRPTRRWNHKMGFSLAAEIRHVTTREPLGSLLHGFFHFFSQEFSWEDEVVSVRQGSRLTLDSECFCPRLRHPTSSCLNVEDPFLLARNLNFALGRKTLHHLQDEVEEARKLLARGGTLWELLGTQADKYQAESRRFGAELLEGFLPLPVFEVEDNPDVESFENGAYGCAECLKFFQDGKALKEHQEAMNHSGYLRSVRFDG